MAWYYRRYAGEIMKMLMNRNFVLFLWLVWAQNSWAVEFSIFGDINLKKTEIDNKKTDNGFALGGLDLFATQDVGTKTKALMEFVFEDTGDGFIVDVERLWIRYALNNALNISMGRFHTPIGFWNKNYHHGSLIQDTVNRPFFLDFEDGDVGILPVHAVGLKLAGQINSGNNVLNYELLTANSAILDTTQTTAGIYDFPEILVNNAADSSNKKSLIFAFNYEYMPFGIDLGVFGMNQNYSHREAGKIINGNYADQYISGFYVRYNLKRFYALSETFFIKNQYEKPSVSYESQAGYLQLGLRMTENFSLIYRRDELKADDKDPYFDILIGKNNIPIHTYRNVWALRYNIDESNAIKLEFSDGKHETEASLQWSFLLF